MGGTPMLPPSDPKDPGGSGDLLETIFTPRGERNLKKERGGERKRSTMNGY